MSMIKPYIDRIDDRQAAIYELFLDNMPGRNVTRDFKHYTEYDNDLLEQGVVAVVSSGEKDYSTNRGQSARRGVHRVLLIAALMLPGKPKGQDIEIAELQLIEQLKDVVRIGLPGTTIRLDSGQHSRQLECPYGWAVAYLDILPPEHDLA